MLLSELFDLDIVNDCTIEQLCNDSRKVKPGSLFLAYPGIANDGRKHILDAVNNGAIAIAYDPQNWPEMNNLSVPCVAVRNLSQNIAAISSKFYQNSTNNISVIGITGTNGKTTIAYQLTQAYSLLGLSSVYIGTLGLGKINELQETNNTTPDALQLQSFLFECQQKDVKYVCMEVSSHALIQHRVDKIAFKQAIYTNLSHEHLDYHHTMDNYANAKAQLFAFSSLEIAIINADDLYASLMIDQIPNKCRVLTYGMHVDCDIFASNIQLSMHGSEFDVRTPWGSCKIEVNVVGTFNIYNSLAVLASLLGNGYSLETIAFVMKKLSASPGRMEIVSKNPCVLVDYAHTPDALQNALNSLMKLKTASAKLWVVFGCGGDRDSSKRPVMGKIAIELADYVVITSDNPRSESPEKIIKEILDNNLPSNHILPIPDRKTAIEYALAHASKDDLILIAGKGHESYQIINNDKSYFSDQDVVRQYYCK